MVRLLVEQGASVNATDICGDSPARVATRCGYIDILSYLLSQGAAIMGQNNSSLLHVAASNNKLSIAKYLVTQGVDVNLANKGGQTALHIASLQGYETLVKFLLEEGAQVNVVENENKKRTALHHAASIGHQGIVNDLLAYGASILLTDKDGMTASKVAEVNHHKAVVATIDKEKGERYRKGFLR